MRHDYDYDFDSTKYMCHLTLAKETGLFFSRANHIDGGNDQSISVFYAFRVDHNSSQLIKEYKSHPFLQRVLTKIDKMLRRISSTSESRSPVRRRRQQVTHLTPQMRRSINILTDELPRVTGHHRIPADDVSVVAYTVPNTNNTYEMVKRVRGGHAYWYWNNLTYRTYHKMTRLIREFDAERPIRAQALPIQNGENPVAYENRIDRETINIIMERRAHVALAINNAQVPANDLNSIIFPIET